METSKTKTKSLTIGVGFNMKPTIGKTLCLLLIATALTLLSACQTTQTDEPKWNDMYEVRQYEVKTETYTNEIVTTVFTLRLAETNVIKTVSKPTVTDFGGYDWDYVETPVVKENLTTPEFQCVDGSCEVKEK